MNWTNVRLILQREVRDQLRDRRTLFMIAVLPLLLYPLLGMSFFQVAQFMREQAVKVLLIGAHDFADLPPLVEGQHFALSLFSDAGRARLMDLEFALDTAADAEAGQQAADTLAKEGGYDVVIYFPPDFAERLQQFRRELIERDAAKEPAAKEPAAKEPAEKEPAKGPDVKPGEVPIPEARVFWNEAKERSKIGYLRATDVLSRWRDRLVERNLAESRIPAAAARPFELKMVDVANEGQGQAALWSRILPFVLLLWALTGAFYPAVDLCAGEKERGTLETLLSSPAERSEIVWGKLLTIMIFSMATAVLNLLSLGITGSLVLSQLPNQPHLGPPPAIAVVWLLIALVPVSALFSALCLALAAFARSTKEGQYYLMPLVLITLPLTVLPMAPGVELNLGNSLIPVTGMVLLLRTMLEGNYAAALPFIPPVVAVTLTCCLFAMRWAADQFNSESVLFRESERLDVALWLKHLMRDREDTPTVPAAVLCGVLILLVQFFMGLALQKSQQNLAELAVVTQLVVVATPALLMTIMLTRSPRETLLLRLPRWSTLPAALLLAVALHPVAFALRALVMKIYPIDEQLAAELNRMVGQIEGKWLWLLAIVPPVCEEIAFRGFILSGLRRMGHKWRAIVVSSIFFGVSHTIFQQSLVATILGLVLGFLAVQTGSLLTCVLFHMSHNALMFLAAKLTPAVVAERPLLAWLIDPNDASGQFYRWPAVLIGGLAAAAILLWLRNLPYAHSSEESLQESLDNAAGHPLAG
jgi:sodium transport system permease protein